MAAEKEEKQIVILNRGRRAFDTSRGKLEPGKSMAFTEKEAKDLLGYPELVDAAKAVPENAKTIEALQAENANLKAQVADLQKAAEEASPKKKKE